MPPRLVTVRDDSRLWRILFDPETGRVEFYLYFDFIGVGWYDARSGWSGISLRRGIEPPRDRIALALASRLAHGVRAAPGVFAKDQHLVSENATVYEDESSPQCRLREACRELVVAVELARDERGALQLRHDSQVAMALGRAIAVLAQADVCRSDGSV